jgi:8-oxo-dGTP diphosphatase
MRFEHCLSQLPIVRIRENERKMIDPNPNNLIPLHLYNQIIALLPIVSVEAAIIFEDSLLLLRRKNQPVFGEWWFAGGRIHKEESIDQALIREVKEETGLEILSQRMINVYSRVFPERHDITIAFLCKCTGKLTLNEEHSEYRLIRETPEGLHPYLKEVISDSQWQE